MKKIITRMTAFVMLLCCMAPATVLAETGESGGESQLPLIGLLVAAGAGIVAILVHAVRSANKDN